MPPPFRDDYVRCCRCTSRFIPIYISPATASSRCPYCQFSGCFFQPRLREYPMISLTPPPPPPSPTTPSQSPTPLHTSSVFDFDQEDDDVHNNDFNTLVNLIASETNQYESRPTPASESFICSLKADEQTVSQQLINAGPCAICSDEFKLLEKVNQLSCRHWFHTDCIIPWLNWKNNCPLCRHEFPSTDYSLRLEHRTTETTSGNSSPTLSDHSLGLEHRTTATTSGNSSPTLSVSQPVPSARVRVRRTARMRTVFVHRIRRDR